MYKTAGKTTGNTETVRQSSWKKIGVATSVGYSRKPNGEGYIFEMPMERYSGKWKLMFRTGGKFRNIMILGARSKKSPSSTWRILYNGNKKIISYKDIGRKHLNYPVLLIKLNGTEKGFHKVQAKATIFIAYEE